MIKLNDEIIEQNNFPDGTLHLNEDIYIVYGQDIPNLISWHYENDAELFTLICLVKHIRRINGEKTKLDLFMPYIPHARMDRVKKDNDVFTLKYFAEVINDLHFNCVYVLDPHSNVSKALLDNVCENPWGDLVQWAADNSVFDSKEKFIIFYPDEGSVKRYASSISYPYAFGVKRRDWKTGQIMGLDVIGESESIKDSNILIIDDICSRGGTFLHSAKKLKELGANKIYLYVTHCENTILEGELLTSGLIEKVYTTNSIFTKEHEKIEVFEL